MLTNKSVGFLHQVQDVDVKIETFTFTRYGVIPGTVFSLPNDAIEDEKRGLVYSARIQLKEKSIQVGERTVLLSPGMAVTAEIKRISAGLLTTS